MGIFLSIILIPSFAFLNFGFLFSFIHGESDIHTGNRYCNISNQIRSDQINSDQTRRRENDNIKIHRRALPHSSNYPQTIQCPCPCPSISLFLLSASLTTPPLILHQKSPAHMINLSDAARGLSSAGLISTLKAGIPSGSGGQE